MPQIKANGITIEYESFGRETDPAILLIMGFSGQLTMWPVALCEGLAAKGFRAIRFDNRDVGKSSHLSDMGTPNIGELMAAVMAGKQATAPYLLSDMANDAAGLLKALGISQAHIVGASMGGMIAQLVAIDHPGLTRSMTSIMSTTGRPGLPPARPEAMAALMTPPPSTDREARIQRTINTFRIIGSPGYPATDAEIRAFAEREVDRVPYDGPGIARQMAAIAASPPRHDMLKSVRVPAQVIHGADDPLVPVEGGKDTAASIPGAELHIVPGMGHDFTDALLPVYLRLIGDFVTKAERQAKVA